jgi:hypothetical protein
MNSANWTEAQKIAAGKRFVERLAQAYCDTAFQAKLHRDKVAIQNRIKALKGEKA